MARAALVPDHAGMSFVRRLPPALSAAAIAVAFLGGMIAIHLAKEVPFAYLTQDPTVIGELAAYAGFLSNAGVIFWCATAAVCLFSAAVLPASARDRSLVQAAGWISALMGLDDLFRLHESVIPRVLGIPELAVYAAYALLGAWFVLRFQEMLLRRDGRLLVTALACFAGSVALDLTSLPIDPYLLEDSLKFAGIACWFVYFARRSFLSLAARGLQPAGHGRDPTALPSLRGGAARRGGAPALRRAQPRHNR